MVLWCNRFIMFMCYSSCINVIFFEYFMFVKLKHVDITLSHMMLLTPLHFEMMRS